MQKGVVLLFGFLIYFRIIRMGRHPFFLQRGYKETVFSKIKEIYLKSAADGTFGGFRHSLFYHYSDALIQIKILIRKLSQVLRCEVLD